MKYGQPAATTPTMKNPNITSGCSPAQLLRRIWAIVMPYASQPQVQWEYDPAGDLLSAWIGNPRAADSIEVEPDFFVRIAPDNQVVGIEIIGASRRIDPRTLCEEVVLSLIDSRAARALQLATKGPQLQLFAAQR